MSLPHALLGLIHYGPAAGYDLKARFRESIYFFWNATLPQIYRTLGKMEANGWVASTVEHQDGKPSRKVYRVSEAGEKEFERWLAEAPEAPAPRVPMLIKAFFGARLPRSRFLEQIKKVREYHARLLGKYEKEIAPQIEEHSHRVGSGEDANFWRLTLDYGRRHAQMTVDWCDAVLKGINEAQKREGQDGGFSSRS